MKLNLKMQEMILPILDRENAHTMESVQTRLNNNSAKLFHNKTALIIAELLEYPLAKVTNIWMGAGDLNGVKSLLPEVESYAKKMDCSRLEFTGREGWKRLNEDGVSPKKYNQHNWIIKSVVMKKELA